MSASNEHIPKDLMSLVTMVERFKTLLIAGESSNSAPSHSYQEISAAANELASRLQDYAAYEESRYDAFEGTDYEPSNPISNNVCEIRFEVEPSTKDKPIQTYTLTGSVFARTYLQQVLFSRTVEIDMPASNSFEISRFDTMLDIIQQIIPTLKKSSESEECKQLAKEILEEIRNKVPDMIESDREDKLVNCD